MSEIDDGGPAFPATVQGWNDRLSQSQNGMSLRDWFAGQAVAGIMAMVAANAHDLPEPKGAVGAAMEAYRLADAMLAERARAVRS